MLLGRKLWFDKKPTTEAANDKLVYLLSIPGDLPVPLLRLDPTWDPLREHPRFKALLAG